MDAATEPRRLKAFKYLGCPVPFWHHPMIFTVALARQASVLGGLSTDLAVEHGLVLATVQFATACVDHLESALKSGPQEPPGTHQFSGFQFHPVFLQCFFNFSKLNIIFSECFDPIKHIFHHKNELIFGWPYQCICQNKNSVCDRYSETSNTGISR